MHLVYVDDSADECAHVFSALAIPAEQWRTCFEQVRHCRRGLRASDGIFLHKEIHAWKFVSGRGQVADRIVTKSRRCAVYREMLGLTASLPGARLLNTVFAAGQDEEAFACLLTHLNLAAEHWDSHVLLFCDEGKEGRYTRLARQMGVHGYAPSGDSNWAGRGGRFVAPVTGIVEDPVFKDSKRSYFIQLADCCAYALLRRERPLASKTAYGLTDAFALLSPILAREATDRDPEGVLRP